MSTNPLVSNVQQLAPEAVAVALSDEERSQLRIDVQRLEERIDTIKEDIRWMDEFVDDKAALKDVQESIAAAEECLRTSTSKAFEAALYKNPLLNWKTKGLSGTEDRKKAIQDYFKNQVERREKKEEELKDVQRRRVVATDKRENLEKELAQKRTFLHTSKPPRREPNPQRKQRWIELNEILQGHAKKSKLNDSTAYPYITWNQVQSVFNLTTHVQPRKAIKDSDLEAVTKYLAMTYKSFGNITSRKDAKLRHFIAPILITVCHLFDGEVEILVEEDLHGKFLNTHGHFEFMLKRGKKAVCIVEAKDDNMEQGTAQNLVGCEVAAELGELDIVYGIVTNYAVWNFYKSCNDKIELEECYLSLSSGAPEQRSLKKIAEKIYYMLSNE